MPTVLDFYNFLNKICPFETQHPYDNSGLIIGDFKSTVKRVVVCLDITHKTIEFCLENGVNLIISHHPVIFDPLKNVLSNTLVYSLIKNEVNVIAAHTNLDAALGGVNDSLCELLGIENTKSLMDPNFSHLPGIARIGEIAPTTATQFAKTVKEKLNAPDLRLTNPQKLIKKVCVLGGAGHDFIFEAIKHGADCYITSEIKHDEWIFTNGLDLSLIDAGHFATEQVVIKPLITRIKDEFGDLVADYNENPPFLTI